MEGAVVVGQYSAEERRVTTESASNFCRVHARDVGEEGAGNAYASAFHDGSDVKAISAMVVKGRKCLQSAQ
jgi:hypothetical protein